jgi:putative cell wall-binding protein
MRFPRRRTRRAAMLSPLAMFTTIALSVGILGAATPAFADGPDGPAVQLVATVSGDFIAGVPQTVTLTAEDAGGNPDLAWNGTASVFTSEDSTADSFFPGGTSDVTVTDGVGTIELELDTAGPQEISANDDDDVLSDVLTPVTVDPGPTASIAIVGVPATVAAGVPFSYTVNQLDAFGNIVALDGDDIEVYTSDPDFDNDVHTYEGSGTYTARFTVADEYAEITAFDPNNSAISITQALSVTGVIEPTQLVETVDNPSSVAGATTQVTVSAEDAYGDIAATDNSALDVVSTDPQAVINGGDPVTLVNGTATFPVVLDTVGDQSVDVFDDAEEIFTSADVTVTPVVVPAVATHLSISPAQNPQTAGVPSTFTVSALDADGNVVTTDNDDVSVYDSTGLANLGGNGFSTSVALVNGVATISDTFDFATTQTLYAYTDTIGGNTEISVVPGPVAALSFSGVAESVPAGTLYTFSVYASDQFGNVVNISPSAQVTWSSNADPSNPTTVNFVEGLATITGSFDTVGVAGVGTVHVVDGDDTELTADASIDVTPVAVPGGGSSSAPVTNPLTADRVAGADRFATATAISAKEFPTAGSAGAVVLARSDDAADSTVGTVLAAAKNAPLLFTSGATVPAATLAEITRSLRPGGTVYVLGGTAAIPASAATQLSTLGFKVVRLAGADRYGTAIAVAGAIGGNGPVFLATGTGFADALAAGPAAAHGDGVVLLTDGGTLPASVKAYLAAHPSKVFAVGGQAVAADASAIAVAGTDRYATAAAVATTFFTTPSNIGVASGATFADALSGGAYLAHLDGPLLLTAPSSLSAPTSDYLNTMAASTKAAFTFGGADAISADTQTQIDGALDN